MPACVAACPTSARHFGDLGDPSSAVSQLVAERGGVDLMPELGYQPTNKYLPPRAHTQGAPRSVAGARTASRYGPRAVSWAGSTACCRADETDPCIQPSPSSFSPPATGAGYGLLALLGVRLARRSGIIPNDRLARLHRHGTRRSALDCGRSFIVDGSSRPPRTRLAGVLAVAQHHGCHAKACLRFRHHSFAAVAVRRIGWVLSWAEPADGWAAAGLIAAVVLPVVTVCTTGDDLCVAETHRRSGTRRFTLPAYLHFLGDDRQPC